VRVVHSGVPADIRGGVRHGEVAGRQRGRGPDRQEGGGPVSAPTAPPGSAADPGRPPAADRPVIAAPGPPPWPRLRTYLGALGIPVWGLPPFYWMVVTALRDNVHTFSQNPLPSHLTLDNFKQALDTSGGNDFLAAIGNSVLISLVTTAAAIVFGVFAAYALARVEFRGKFI